jgi:hypothetical protein
MPKQRAMITLGTISLVMLAGGLLVVIAFMAVANAGGSQGHHEPERPAAVPSGAAKRSRERLEAPAAPAVPGSRPALQRPLVTPVRLTSIQPGERAQLAGLLAKEQPQATSA